ncbi:nucleolar protein 4 [Babesia caballi]|uniref:Nucleolar protein 4 n=1 Tax=Babesia caballi TaxID=5871 RepID=A0AAV4LTM2_BABCB|nr:nucleolar protein 4 [Babesia caballi]
MLSRVTHPGVNFLDGRELEGPGDAAGGSLDRAVQLRNEGVEVLDAGLAGACRGRGDGQQGGVDAELLQAALELTQQRVEVLKGRLVGGDRRGGIDIGGGEWLLAQRLALGWRQDALETVIVD